jgi:hypothetical protein
MDFGFNRFLTSSLIKFVYGFVVVLTLVGLLGVLYLAVTGRGEALGTSDVGIYVFLSALGGLVTIVMTRILCELGIILFRIDEHLQQIIAVGGPSRSAVCGMEEQLQQVMLRLPEAAPPSVRTSSPSASAGSETSGEWSAY